MKTAGAFFVTMMEGQKRLSELFRSVKSAVTARKAAEMYGLKVNRAGMACCPFHNDRAPSLKLDDRFYCFGCGATGDAVDLTARLLGVNSKDAALQLVADFEIQIPEKLSWHPPRPKVRSRVDPEKETDVWVNHAIRIMTDYLWKLREWKKKYAPQSMDDDNWYPLFCEALEKTSYVEYVLDEMLAAGKSEYEELRRAFGKEVDKVEKRLERYAAGDASGD